MSVLCFPRVFPTPPCVSLPPLHSPMPPLPLPSMYSVPLDSKRMNVRTPFCPSCVDPPSDFGGPLENDETHSSSIVLLPAQFEFPSEKTPRSQSRGPPPLSRRICTENVAPTESVVVAPPTPPPPFPPPPKTRRSTSPRCRSPQIHPAATALGCGTSAFSLTGETTSLTDPIPAPMNRGNSARTSSR